jgi:hypothetical protein
MRQFQKFGPRLLCFAPAQGAGSVEMTEPAQLKEPLSFSRVVGERKAMKKPADDPA